MDPLSMLLAAPGLIQGISSLFGAGGARDPLGESNRTYEWLMSRFGPGATLGHANEFYRGMKGSPMYQSAFRNMSLGAGQSQQALNRNLAAAGIGGSGVGQIRRALGPSVMAGQVGNLNSNVYGMGLNSIMQMMPNIMNASMGARGRAPAGMNWLNFAKGIENTDWRPFMDFFSGLGKKPFDWRTQGAGGPTPNGPFDPYGGR